jgi:hypothetical protein
MSAAPFTTKHLAEQAGAAVADNCLKDIQDATNQAERVAVLQSALLHLQALPHPKRAAGGFAVALVAYLERGLAK